jgi:hypothetical protein
VETSPRSLLRPSLTTAAICGETGMTFSATGSRWGQSSITGVSPCSPSPAPSATAASLLYPSLVFSISLEVDLILTTVAWI